MTHKRDCPTFQTMVASMPGSSSLNLGNEGGFGLRIQVSLRRQMIHKGAD